MANCWKQKLTTEDVELAQYDNNSHHLLRKTPERCSTVCVKKWLRNNLLLVLTMLGIVAGFVVGVLVRTTDPSKDAIMWLGLPGDIFMRTLKMLILPLVICSVISGMSTLDPRSNGKITIIALAYIGVANLIGSTLGLLVSFMIPTEQYNMAVEGIDSDVLRSEDIFADLFRNIFPDNLVAAAFSQVQTKYSTEPRLSSANNTNTTRSTHNIIIKSLGTVQSTNLLGLMVCSVLIAVAANKSGPKGKAFVQFFSSATEIFLILLRWVIWSTPLGVLSLISATLATIANLEATFASVAYFVVAVTSGVAAHQLVILPLVVFAFVRKNPFPVMLSLAKVWLVALATTSTAVAMPEMFEALETKHQIDQRVSRFVVPLNVTLAAPGSAIFIVAAVVFVGKISGVHLTSADLVIILVLTAIAATSIPSVPSASIVTILIIANSVNIPLRHAGLLFAVEWFLDRIRTSSNAISHTICGLVAYRLCKKDLKTLDDIDQEHETVEQNQKTQFQLEPEIHT